MTPRRRNIEIKSLFYITHIDNVKSILDNGVFSHQLMEERGLPFTPIYDMDIVSNRKHKHTPSGKSLWNYANVYFQARNPMLYRVVLEKDYKNLAVVALKPSILQIPGAFITNGNAANEITAFYDYKSGMKVISDIWSTIMGEWWNSLDGSKRRIMSECLIPERIPADYIHSVYVADHAVAQKIAEIIPGTVIPIIPEPNMFFIPKRRYQVSRNLLLAEGDMFFSNMQTLTISVNVVGVMGKGLASRAKYQFPDVYVVYQDACRNKKLKMGKPFLYKRESSLDEELM
ncbi:MAG: DarT ssDNA thymidine ADP-ribosyltransferase family protein, partial [bacterium]|nr:DarT ssDNA thymidine ADP-ribosyltransferase family protein [bacterium]